MNGRSLFLRVLFFLSFFLDKDATLSNLERLIRRKRKLHVAQQIDRNKILAVKNNPYDEAATMTFVTSGVNHIRGWSLKDDVLKGHSWTGEMLILHCFSRACVVFCCFVLVVSFFCWLVRHEGDWCVKRGVILIPFSR